MIQVLITITQLASYEFDPPQPPLIRGENPEVPLIKGDLGGSKLLYL